MKLTFTKGSQTIVIDDKGKGIDGILTTDSKLTNYPQIKLTKGSVTKYFRTIWAWLTGTATFTHKETKGSHFWDFLDSKTGFRFRHRIIKKTGRRESLVFFSSSYTKKSISGTIEGIKFSSSTIFKGNPDGPCFECSENLFKAFESKRNGDTANYEID